MIRIKEALTWLLWTILLTITVSIIQMYSRDITLDKVHRIEFNLLYKFFNENDNLKEKKLLSVLQPLSSKVGYAHFQVAIISRNSCNENTKHYYNRPLLCKTFKNFQDLVPFLNQKEFRSANVVNDLSESYLIKEFDQKNHYFIAKTNFYFEDNELERFLYFLKYRYYQTNGIKKIFEKGKFLFFIIFLVSFIVWLLNELKYKKYYIELNFRT